MGFNIDIDKIRILQRPTSIEFRNPKQIRIDNDKNSKH